ncbi:alpha/beta hydrolase-fold protein [Brevundimonas sp.]|uniref:alpha/beta hydrolase-fold protein n=1 Tax=Brevundimonas sp. TaxID=1871086 RepID=UPI00289B0C97|nr:alpha/beta hydrolase-fold protein [Brevundimonas sp.]
MTMSAPVFTDASPPLTGGCRTLHLPAEAEAPGLTLWINKPSGERPPQGWPALIMLDGEAYFTAAAEMAQRLARRSTKTRIEPLMIVGIALDDSADRQATFGFSSLEERSGAPPRGQHLLQRLILDILPRMEMEGADTANLTLLGHSMSGLFVLEARAAAAPFARYVAVGPSIWSNPSVIHAQPSGSTCADDLTVFVGSEEETEGLTQDHLARRMISNTRSLLAKAGVMLSVLNDEDHGSTPYASLPAALRFASRP